MKKKTFFKILTICMSVVLILMGLNLNAYAVSSTSTGSITVSGVESGVAVTAYQLTTVNYDDEALQPKAAPYSWVNDNVKTWVKSYNSAYGDPEAFYNAVNNSSEDATEFYSKLAAAIKGETLQLAGTTQNADTSGTTTFTNCAMGTYLILIENGYRVYTPSVVNLTPSFNTTTSAWELASSVSVKVKSSEPTITKTIGSGLNTTDNFSTKDTINYTIVSDKPNYEAESLGTTYKIEDVLTGGLVLNTTSIEVYGVKGEVDTPLTKDTDYTLTITGTSKFEVNFVYDNLSNYDSVKVTYSAELSKSASTLLTSAGNTNTATLTYSNNPYATDTKTKTSTNTVYTYGIEITKVDKSDNSKALPGATFELTDGTSTLYFVRTDDGIYYQTTDKDTNKVTTLAVNSTTGILKIYGLDEGTYYLKETKAPDGYNIATGSLEIEITDSDTNGILNTGSETNGIYSTLFQNGKEFQLPTTGGIGTVVFAAVGVVVIGLGCTLLFISFKKRKAE